MSKNTGQLQAFNDIWGCNSKDPISSSEPSFEQCCNIAFNGEHYEVSLPLIHDIVDPVFDSKYSFCHNHLLVSQKRFKNNPEVYSKYNEICQE